MRDVRTDLSIKDKFREYKQSHLKSRTEVKFLPDITGIGVDCFWRQINFPGCCPDVASIKQGEKRSLFLRREKAQTPATRNMP